MYINSFIIWMVISMNMHCLIARITCFTDLFNLVYIILYVFSPSVIFQSDSDDELVEERMKSPFGSSIRTFDATDYKPIGIYNSPSFSEALI